MQYMTECTMTAEERRLERLRRIQRRLFPGDRHLLPRVLTAPVEEVIRWRQSGRSA